VDVDAPDGVRFRPLNEAGEPTHVARVVHVDDRFVMAWASDAGTVSVRELTDSGLLQPTVVVAVDGHRDVPFLVLRPERDGASLIIRTRRGLLQWELATPIAGRAVALQVVRGLCPAPR
jgi:hypothetical protein